MPSEARDIPLKRLLEGVRSGEITPDDALARLRNLPFEDLGFCKADHHRRLRTGFPEVVFCQGKTEDQVLEILRALAAGPGGGGGGAGGDGGVALPVLATRAWPELGRRAILEIPGAEWLETSRIIRVGRPPDPPAGLRPVVVAAAGTADLPVAEEASVTAESFGCRVQRVYDVGVAGIHRLFAQREVLDRAAVVVAVAGMEGALASVVGGLVPVPVIAVPTSVGYGASFGGLAALLAMLNSCAPGVAVVNIDNGFGAGVVAASIVRIVRLMSTDLS